MWNIRRLVQMLAVLIAMVLAWSGPATAVLAQDDATSPGDQPLEIVVDGERFVFDRNVPIDLEGLEESIDDDGNPVFTKPDDPFGAVYMPTGDDAMAARYLPELLSSPGTSCLSETVAAGTITAGDTVYVPAGPEPDLSSDALVEVGSTDDGRTIYAASEEQPFNELFADSDEGLVRYLMLTDQGAPVTFPGTVVFAGQEFEVATDAEDPGTDGLVKIGCFGPFPALAEEGAEAPFATVSLSLADQVVTYQALDLPAETEAVDEPATPPEAEETAVSTPAETEEAPIEPEETAEATPPPPTELPAATPTEVPPTDVPTEVPTEAPPTEEPAPTEVPPTEAPAPTATEAPSPTAPPATEVPAATAPPAIEVPAPVATQAATPTAPPATQAPAATQTTTPAQTPADPAAPTPPPTPRPTPTPRVYQPAAVVPTLPPAAPPPAVATAPATQCSGETGALDANGIPERLPNSLQYGGTGYRFAGVVPVAEAGNLSLIGCVGPFEAYRGDAQDVTRVLFLALPNGGGSLFRYDATASFGVSFEVSDNPQSLTLQGPGDQPDVRYTASEPWVRSVYSSVTLILYVADPNNAQLDRIYGRPVDSDVIAEYVPEGSVEGVSEEVTALAEQAGLQPDLTLGAGGPRYVLAAVWQPFGTTTNGWLTLYGPAGEAVPARLVGVDPRRLDLLIFEQAP